MKDHLRAQAGVDLAIRLAAVHVRDHGEPSVWAVVFGEKILRGTVHTDGRVTLSGDVTMGPTVRRV